MITIEQLLEESRAWDKLRSTMDRGSYCEDAGSDYISASQIKRAYDDLVDKMIKHERNSYKMPPKPKPIQYDGDK